MGASAIIRPDILSMEYHGLISRLTEIKQKTVSDPLIQNVICKQAHAQF